MNHNHVLRMSEDHIMKTMEKNELKQKKAEEHTLSLSKDSKQYHSMKNMKMPEDEKLKMETKVLKQTNLQENLAREKRR